MEEFDGNAFFFQRGQNGIYHLCLVIQPTTTVTEAIISRNEGVVLLTSEIKFMLNGGFRTHSVFCKSGNHAFEKGTRTCFPGHAVGANHIAKHTASMWDVG